jgi:hypothetical protein
MRGFFALLIEGTNDKRKEERRIMIEGESNNRAPIRRNRA